MKHVSRCDRERSVATIIDFAMWINPQQIEHRRREVFGATGWSRRKRRVRVRRSVDVPARHAAARQQRRIALGPVIATFVLVDLWRPPEFAHPNDQRFVQQAAMVQVVHSVGSV